MTNNCSVSLHIKIRVITAKRSRWAGVVARTEITEALSGLYRISISLGRIRCGWDIVRRNFKDIQIYQFNKLDESSPE